MSHFTVMVIGENPEDQLAPYDERLVVPRYVKATKSELIEEARKKIIDYRDSTYAEFIADPEAYKKATINKGHIDYLENEFPKNLLWNDEDLYTYAIRYYSNGDIGINGEVYSEYNPNSKWDWYSLGGRWSGLIKLKDGAKGITGTSGAFGNTPGIDQARKCDIENLHDLKTFAVVKDGKWYERGEMGWFALVSNEKPDDQWDKEFKKLIEGLPDDTLISIYDCHI